MKQLVSRKTKEKMDQLLDEKFIKNFLDSNLLTFFQDSKKIIKLTKNVHKNSREKYSYTLVLEFVLEILFKDGSIKEKSVFCKAHSEEEKNKALYYMDILYKNGFNDGLYQVPRPLIYLPDFRAGFYEGVIGHNLLYYIKNGEHKKIKSIIKDAVGWINKLHNFDTVNFKPLELSPKKINDNKFSMNNIMKDMQRDHRALYIKFYPLYKKTIKYENTLYKKLTRDETSKLIYADYHPENIITPLDARQGVTVIDFTDLTIGDPYRDVGTFLEQIRAMSPKNKFAVWQKIFLEEYIRSNNITLTALDWQRINLYRLRTSLKSIIYFFYKCDHRGTKLINVAKIYLNKLEKKEIGL